ncbi:MAG TPA: STY0301 family protein [Candidatus Binataceae bacterium]|nr:STY0301 family protein [Candidatus Binataceae bacterium]
MAIAVATSSVATSYAQVACPASVAVDQKASAPEDWSLGYSKAPAELSSVTIFAGPPEEMASLKYDDERTAGNEIIQTWQLPASPHGYWIVCGYTNTTAQLRRKLPDDSRACEVVMAKNETWGNGGAVIKRARCAPPPAPKAAASGS